MKPGEIVVVRLSGGLTVARFAAMEASRVKLTLGRNREAKIAADRVILTTGIEAAQDAQVDEFREGCSKLVDEIDGDIAVCDHQDPTDSKQGYQYEDGCKRI